MPTGADTIISKVGTDGLVAEEQIPYGSKKKK